MPTGYTAGIENGTITSFEDYVKICMRAFGVYIDYRDEPLSTKVPTKMVPDTQYHEEELATILKEQTEFLEKSYEEKRRDYREYVTGVTMRYSDDKEEYQRLKGLYDYFQKKVINWVPPTEDHENFKSFMFDQLRVSLPHEPYEPKLYTYDEWLKSKLEWFDSYIEYHQKEIKNIISNTNRKNEWSEKVLNSLKTRPIEYIGSFETSGVLNVSDPCYELGTWCTHTLSVRPGTYRAYVEPSDEGVWGDRNASLIISFDGIEYDRSKETRTEAEIGVDSGQAGFFDRIYYPKEETGAYGDTNTFYGKACEQTNNAFQAGIVENFGVVSSSGYGDGGYALYIVLTDGEITGARIEFISEETDPEQVHDDGVREEIEGENFSFV